MRKLVTGGVVDVTFSPAGPDGDSRRRRRPNTEQAHPMTPQRFDAENLSVCFTALEEQHKEETSARKRKATKATVRLIR